MLCDSRVTLILKTILKTIRGQLLPEKMRLENVIRGTSPENAIRKFCEYVALVATRERVYNFPMKAYQKKWGEN
jgi:hypothetical protein